MTWVLAFILFLGNFVQGAVGFGSTLIIVTLGAYFFPISDILPVLAPLDLVILLGLAYRERAYIHMRELFRQILPAMAVGMTIGFVAIPFGDHGGLRLAFAAFVTLLSLLELTRGMRGDDATPRPLPPWQGKLLLVAAGVIHSVFSTAGPLVVAYAGRVLTDRRVFRATLILLWCITSATLMIRFGAGGFLTSESLKMTGLGFFPVLMGTWIGARAHHHINPTQFRRLVYGLLLLGGSSLLVKSLMGMH